jgi:hypothetical protein
LIAYHAAEDAPTDSSVVAEEVEEYLETFKYQVLPPARALLNVGRSVSLGLVCISSAKAMAAFEEEKEYPRCRACSVPNDLFYSILLTILQSGQRCWQWYCKCAKHRKWWIKWGGDA